MPKVESDREDVRQHLEKLVTLFQDCGGFIHDDLLITSREGGLGIEAPPSVAPGERILSIPTEYLPPVEDYDLHLEGDDICFGKINSGIDPVQRALMEEMIAIYNLCEKIKIHNQTTPSRLLLREPEVFKRLVFPGQMMAREKSKGKDFYLDDFLHSRVFDGSNFEEGEENGEKVKNSVLLPIIDFLNHHQNAGGFAVKDGQMMVSRSPQIPGTNECFVRYSRMDAQVAFATYGFVDTQAEWLLSCPLTIVLPSGGEIAVKRMPGANRKRPPPANLKDIRAMVPAMGIPGKERHMQMSFLMIPGERSPRAMRRVLAHAIQLLAGSIDNDKLLEQIGIAERQVIEGNRRYYTDLKTYAQGVTLPDDLQPVLDDAIRMADHQLMLLQEYETRTAKMLAARAGVLQKQPG